MEDRFNVLILDDDIEMSNLLSSFVSSINYDFTESHNINDAINILATQKIHAAIVDLHMTELNEDGTDVVKYIKENNLDIPVIIVTGYKLKDYERKISEPVFDVILKPVNFDYLKVTLSRALNKT